MVLIGWVLFGGVFRSTPDPVVVTGVDIITTEQFDALLARDVPPAPETEVEAPVAPEITADPVPAPQTPPDPVTPPEPPAPTEAPPVDPVPEVLPDPVPPVPEVAPAPAEITPPTPEPEVSAPDLSARPVARPVRRVAPEAVATPDPDVQIAEVDQAPSEPAETAEPVEEAQEATAREEAATEIPTEPQAVASAPVTSVRPKARPSRPTQSAQTQTETPAEPAEPSEPAEPAESVQTNSSSVEDALAQALADTPAAPSGPPLTQGEKDALRISVQECWVVDVGSQAANVTVTVAMSLDRTGKVQSGSLRMLSAEGGSENAARAAFDAARRAILRCQRSGYNLPIEKYDHWRDVEMTFNPENMRRR